jgi:hypothetical protein
LIAAIRDNGSKRLRDQVELFTVSPKAEKLSFPKKKTIEKIEMLIAAREKSR